MSVPRRRDRGLSVDHLVRMVEQVNATDRSFFKSQPWRAHRIRIASTFEMRLFAVDARVETPPAGHRYVAVVHHDATGCSRAFCWAPIGEDLDRSETDCRALYYALTTGTHRPLGEFAR